MTKAKLERTVKLVTALLTVVLCFLVVLGFSLYIKASVLSKKNASLDRQINELSITKAGLEAGIEMRKSDAYIEQQAREQLGMIRDDETIFIID